MVSFLVAGESLIVNGGLSGSKLPNMPNRIVTQASCCGTTFSFADTICAPDGISTLVNLRPVKLDVFDAPLPNQTVLD